MDMRWLWGQKVWCIKSKAATSCAIQCGEQCFAAQRVSIAQTCACVCCMVLWHPIIHNCTFNFSSWSYLDRNPLIYCIMGWVIFWESVRNPYARTFTSASGVWDGATVWEFSHARACPIPAWGCVFLYPLSRGVSATKAHLQTSISLTLCWWVSAEPLIVLGVLGQHTLISLWEHKCVFKHVNVWCVTIKKSILKTLVLSEVKMGRG